MDRHSGGGPPPHLRGRPVSGLEAAHANEYFEPFLNATTLKNILGYHRAMCEFLHLKPNVFTHFYPKLRANLTSWRAKALWKKFDARASHKCYGKGKACTGTRVLIIGAGPCGLRTAIEAQLLGAKVVVIEKRDRLSRNNVLHLWPFVIEDLRMLGAKKFFGKFCAGSIDHISIRQIQCILLKVALVLGVEIHTEVSFEKVLEPSSTEKTGWRAEIKPENHPVSQYEFDVIIGADGKRNTLQGFKRKEFRGKLAIAITANFINKKSEAEARVEEISGVAFIFNQKFFKDLQEETRIDLENIVYYKDDTHYFVMTAKKASLLEKGVIKQDLSDTEKLLAPDNVDRDALQNYARQAADFSTNYQLPHLEFAVNHYGQPDVAMFDFTSMYAAEYASKVVERHGSRLLMILVGDSLLEPFWPTGSGCARGFLSSLDAAWAIRSYCSGQMTPLDVLAERESIYRLLAQTTPDNLNKDWKAYTLDPATRYPNLNKSVVTSHQTVCLYDTDNAESIDKMKRASLEAVSRQEHIPKKRRRGNVDNEVLVSWLCEQLREHKDISITDVSSAFRNGKTLCAIIHHYRPDLLDYSAIKDNEPTKCNQLAMDILEKDLGLPPFMTGEEITNTEDYLAMATYLTQVYDTFRGEIPHIKHPKLNIPKISSETPKSIPKSPSKSRKNILSPALLGKVKTIEEKYMQITNTKQNIPAIKYGRGKGSGDEETLGKEKKIEKLKFARKDSDIHTGIEVFGIEKRQKQISSDDLAITDKKIKSKIPKKTLKRHSCIGCKPSKTLSEQTFLTASIKSLKNIEKKKYSECHRKTDFFDLTYSDASLMGKISKSKKVASSNHLHEKTLKPQIPGSSIKGENRAKKVKSRNVSVSVNLGEMKILKKKKIKTKKSKLSVIPEQMEEKSGMESKPRVESVNHTENKYIESSERNINETLKCVGETIIDSESGKFSNENQRMDVINGNDTEFHQNESLSKDQNANLNFKNSVKVFRCETFIQDSFDSLALPNIPSLVALNQRNLIKNAEAAKISESIQEDISEKRKNTDILNEDIINPHSRSVFPKTSKPKLKHKEKSLSNMKFKKISPLQVIKKHLQIKKQQISLALSQPKVPAAVNNISVSKSNINLSRVSSTNLVQNLLEDKKGTHFSNIKTHSRESIASSLRSINIEVIHKSSSERITYQNVEYNSSLNVVKITSRNSLRKLVFLHSGKASGSKELTNKNSQIRRSKLSRGNCENVNVRTEKVEQIYENKERFLKSDASTYLGTIRYPCSPQFDKRRRVRTRKSKTHLPTKERIITLTPADAQIIHSLGTSVTETSNLKKSCSKTFKNSGDCQKRQKFSLKDSLRSTIVKRQKLYGDLRSSVTLDKGFGKLNNNISEEQKRILKMEFYEDGDNLSPQIYTRVQKWISQHDFKVDEMKKDPEGETLITCDIPSDITSVTRAHVKRRGEYDDIKVEERTDVIKCESPISSSQEDFVELVKNIKDAKTLTPKENKTLTVKPISKYSQYNMKSVSAPPANFSVIVEGEESELPENNKRSEFSFKTTNYQPSIPNNQLSRPSSRHKRHAEVVVPKPCSIDKKQRKRRTLERIGPSVIYSRWFLPLVETVVVGIMLLIFDMYVNPEEYMEPPTSFLDYLWS